MHSSRMRTARSSSRPGGVSTRHPRAGTPRDQAPPQADPPQLPPWVWTWTRSSSTSPLDVGLDQIPLNFPFGCGPGDPQPLETCCKACWDTACNACWDSTPSPWRPAARHAGIAPPCGQTHTCKHITLPQTSFAGGSNESKPKHIFHTCKGRCE